MTTPRDLRYAGYRYLEMAVAGSSAISYLNMGRPETILVDTDKRVTKMEE